MKGKRIITLLALVMLVSGALFGCTDTNQTASQGEVSIVNNYPGLESLVDFVGEDNLSVLSLVGFRAADRAMKNLSFNKGSSNVLAITDAGYSIIEIGAGFPDTYYTTEGAIDGISATSGCTLGQGNLILLHQSIYNDLWFFFFDKNKGGCVYLEVDQEILKNYLDDEAAGDADYAAFMSLSDSTLFSKISKENIKPSRLIEAAGAGAWHHNFTDGTFGGNEFSVVTICAVWDKGVSYEFIKSAELHNHICPGLTSGYFIARYLDENFPLEGENECYIVWSVPPWCKDDAFQIIFDATVGKQYMAVMYISQDIQDKIYPEYQNIAGIYIRFNEATGEAQAIVLGWDWSKAYSDCGISGADFSDFSTYKYWWSRLRADVLLMDHEPEEYVSTFKVVDLGNQGSVKNMMANWMAAGSNPLVELGIMP
jgi:formylmethanofuran dehydrogenase subunit E-like metal-binding protein